MQKKIEIKNKKASYEYFLMDKFTAGIVLTGTEIKSIRNAKASIGEAYCVVVKDEVFIRNMHISEYSFAAHNNHEPRRDRKLLLTAREIRKIIQKTKEKGNSIIPILLYISDKGFAKVDIAIAKGKKLYDKRESIKSKDIDRDLKRQRIR